jgi:hypothetical protein
LRRAFATGQLSLEAEVRGRGRHRAGAARLRGHTARTAESWASDGPPLLATGFEGSLEVDA